MKKIILILLFSAICRLSGMAQCNNWLWAKGGVINTTTNTPFGDNNQICTDVSGNSFITGYFTSPTISFGTFNLANNGGSGSWDIYVVKYNSVGIVQWAVSAGGAGDDAGIGICADNAGGVYVVGYYGSQSIANYGITTQSGNVDYFIAKYNDLGTSTTLAWAKSGGGSVVDIATSVSVDNNGVYVTGYFSSSQINIPNTIPVFTLTNSNASGNYTNLFIVKYDKTNGNPIWATPVSGSGPVGEVEDDWVNSISCDGSGYFYITGYFQNSMITFAGNTLTNFSGPGNDGFFIAKYSSAGIPVWGRQPQPVAGGTMAQGVCVTASDITGNSHNIYVTGKLESASIFGGTNLTPYGGNDMFVVRYDASGNVIWANSAGGTQRETGMSVSEDNTGNIYVVGGFGSPTMNFGANVLSAVVPPAGYIDQAYIVKYDASGNYLCSSAMTNGGDDAIGVIADNSGNAYIAADYYGSSFTLGTLPTLNSSGIESVFIAKYNCYNSTFIVTDPPAACSPQTVDITAAAVTAGSTSGGILTYWTNSSATTSLNNPNAVVTAGTYYIEYTLNGCTDIEPVTVIINNCCTNGTQTFNYTNVAAMQAINGFTTNTNPVTVTGQTFSINGTFIVDQNLTLSDCNVFMGSNAKIVVNPFKTLDLEGSHLHGCGTLWNTIDVSPQAFINSNGSVLEDADSAIYIETRAQYQINSTVFNKNFIGMAIHYSNAQDYINGSLFTCRDFTTPLNGINNSSNIISDYVATNYNFNTACNCPNTLIDVPYVGNATRSWIGVEAIYSTLQIGQILNGSNYTVAPNIFDYLGYGIKLIYSNATVYNGVFENMVDEVAPPLCLQGGGLPPCPLYYYMSGTAIYGWGAASGGYTATVGGTTANMPNTFHNFSKGVEIENYQNQYILNNTFNNTSTVNDCPGASWAPSFGRYAVWITPANKNTININSNYIANCSQGIYLNRPYPTCINTISTIVDGNTITANGLGHSTVGIYIGDGLVQVPHATPYTIFIQHNTITQTDICINARMVKSALAILDNPELEVKYGSCLNYGKGILAERCQFIQIQGNNYIHGEAITDITNIKYNGIEVINSPVSWVTCNTINHIGESMVFNNKSPLSVLRNNKMSDGKYGFVLRTNGIVSQQGGPNYVPCDMWWALGDFGGLNKAQTYADGTAGSADPNNASPLYCSALNQPSNFLGVPTNNQANSNPQGIAYTNGIHVLTNPPLYTFDCALIPTVGSNGIHTRELLQLVSDTTQYPVYQDEQQYHDKKYVYEQLDSANGYSPDSNMVLKNFYDSAKVATLGQLKEVEKNIKLGNFGTATSINASLSANNNIEANNKMMNYYYLLRLNDSTYQYTSDDSATMYNIAMQCPSEAGDGVWLARVLLSYISNYWVDFEEQCEDQGKHLIHHNIPTKNILNSDFKLYPNPNDGTMTLEYKIIELGIANFRIYDISGRVVEEQVLNSENKSIIINAGELSAGVYYYEIKIGDNRIKTDRIIIIK